MDKPEGKFIWEKWRKRLLNKYAVTLLVFAVLILVVGNHSVWNRVKMAREISQKEAEKADYEQKIRETQEQIDSLNSEDAIERFAREEYLMHADDEDVYLVEEDK